MLMVRTACITVPPLGALQPCTSSLRHRGRARVRAHQTNTVDLHRILRNRIWYRYALAVCHGQLVGASGLTVPQHALASHWE